MKHTFKELVVCVLFVSILATVDVFAGTSRPSVTPPANNTPGPLTVGSAVDYRIPSLALGKSTNATPGTTLDVSGVTSVTSGGVFSWANTSAQYVRVQKVKVDTLAGTGTRPLCFNEASHKVIVC